MRVWVKENSCFSFLKKKEYFLSVCWTLIRIASYIKRYSSLRLTHLDRILSVFEIFLYFLFITDPRNEVWGDRLYHRDRSLNPWVLFKNPNKNWVFCVTCMALDWELIWFCLFSDYVNNHLCPKLPCCKGLRKVFALSLAFTRITTSSLDTCES